MNTKFDAIVIGGGPGGYIAAIRLAQLGFSTACVDGFIKDNKYSLGGTCLNVGCIPSKALLQSSENFAELMHNFKDHGITCDNPKIDIAKMMARKDDIVNKNSNGISYLFKKNKVTEIHGMASFKGKEDNLWQLNVINQDQNTAISATHIIIATGSIPRQLPQVKIDNVDVLDNEGALAITQTPQELCIIGAGVIGLELGSVWKRLGSNVTILESQEVFLSSVDMQVAKEAHKQFKKQGLNIINGIKIENIEQSNKINVTYSYNQNKKSITCDKLVIAIGRVPNTKNLNLAIVDVKLDERNQIIVNDNCQTNIENIWAIGDCVRGPMLAHKAQEEGIFVAEKIAGQKPLHADFDKIPWVIYTSPEIAWVGKNEEQLKAQGIAYKKGIANFMANGRALGMGHNIGFVKMLSCEKTDRILGVHMIGPYVSELISEAVVAMEFMASSEDIARIVHAHPSLSEVTHEAALACDNRQLHG